MKRIICTAAVLSMILSMTACGNDDTSQNTEKQTTTAVITTTARNTVVTVKSDVVDWCGVVSYESEQHAVEDLFRSVSSSIKLGDTEQSWVKTVNELGGIYFYSLENVPENYSAGYISMVGDIAYYNDVYRSAEELSYDIAAQNRIDLYSSYFSDAEEKLQRAINNIANDGDEINEISNYDKYYYVEDEFTYTVYWCEDEHYIYMSFPKSIGTIDPETHEYSGHDIFTLRKTFYPFEETQE